MRLRTAAEVYHVTEFEAGLKEVEMPDEGGQRLAEHLRQLNQNF